MILYHFTHKRHMVTILLDHVLRTTESNIGGPPGYPPVGERVGPDVVWLTDLKEIDREMGLAVPPLPRMSQKESTAYALQTGQAKTEVRFTLDLPDNEVHEWVPWARSHGINGRWLKSLRQLCDADHTWVIERPVTDDEWVRVDQRIGRMWAQCWSPDSPPAPRIGG